jgi:hypothetical protein
MNISQRHNWGTRLDLSLVMIESTMHYIAQIPETENGYGS